MRRRTLLAFPLLALAVACSSTIPPAEGDDDDDVREVASAIINGSIDTTHEAVVAVISQAGGEGGACTGTIVKVDAARKIGWVVTAAHCVVLAPVLVIQGRDYASIDALRYEVIDYKADGRYSGDTSAPYDFAIIRIAGVDASTPTIGLAAVPDNLGGGTPVTSVGYGRTTLIQSGSNDPNTVRRTVNRTLSQVGSTQIGYDMSDRGICQGDSGGPVLIKTPSGERVAGVHSYVQGDCDGFGVSGRATAGSAFWSAELSRALPAEDCELCEKIANSGTQECATYLQQCFSDKDCKGYYDCLSRGTTKATCLSRFPKAEGPFNAAVNCTCTRACADKCADTFQCKTTPKCGYKLPAGDCTTCTEETCCSETLDCAADGTCYLCLKTNDADEACADNPARKKLADCVVTSCKDECAGSGLDTGGEVQEEGGESGAPSTTTITKTEGLCSLGAPGEPMRAGASAWLIGLALAGLTRRRARLTKPSVTK